MSAAGQRVTIFDTTLRDGEQSPGCSLHTAEKVRMALQLERLGVDIIEAGFPAASPGESAAVASIASEVRAPTITLAVAEAGIERAKQEMVAMIAARETVPFQEFMRMNELSCQGSQKFDPGYGSAQAVMRTRMIFCPAGALMVP